MQTGPPDPDAPQYVAYPRGQVAAYGSPDRLEKLAAGYFGLTWVF